MTVANFDENRRKRFQNLTPVEVLDIVKELIEKGELNPRHLLVTLVHRPPGDSLDYPHYFCTPMDYDRRVGLMEAAKTAVIRDWFATDE